MAHPWVAVFVDGALFAFPAAGLLAWAQSGVTGDLTPIVKSPPVEDLAAQQRRCQRSEPLWDRLAVANSLLKNPAPFRHNERDV